MSYNSSGGGMHKRPYDNAPYQGGGEFPGVVVDIKRPRSDQIGGGGGGSGGGGGAGMYGHSGGNTSPRSVGIPGGGHGGAFPRQPGKETCINFRRTGTCKFGESCNYDHPAEAHPSKSGTGVLPPGTAAPPGPSTSGPPQSAQHGHGPRPSSQQQPHNQQQQRQQHPHAHQPKPLQQLGFSIQPQQQHPPYGQQPQAVTQTSLGQQRGSLPLTPGSSAPAGGPSTGGGYTGSSYGNAVGAGGGSSSSTTPSPPAPAQPLGTQLGSPRHPLPTAFNSAEPAPTTKTPDTFEAPSPSVAPAAHGTAGFNPETPRNQGLQQGSTTAHAPTSPAADVIPSGPVPAGTSTSASAAGWVYDHATGGYNIAPPPSALISSAEPASGAAAPGTSGAPVQHYQQRQQPGNAYGTPSTQHHAGPYAGGQALSSIGGGYNAATARHGQKGAAPGVASTADAHPTSPACAPIYSAQKQQPQHKPSNPSAALAGAPSSSTYTSTTGQYSVCPGVTLNPPVQPAAGASCGGSTAPVSVGYGGSSHAASITSEYGLQGIPSVYGVPPSASPQQAHGVSHQTPSLQYGSANSAKGSAATSSAPPTQGGVSSTGTPQPGYVAATGTTPEATSDDYVASGSTGSGRSSQFGAYGALPSYGGQTSASSTGGGQQPVAKVSESIPVSLRSRQADAASISTATNCNRSCGGTPAGSVDLTNKTPSVTKLRAASAASRGSSADAGASSASSPPVAAPAASVSKIDPMASAAAAYAAQQAAAAAATGVACSPAPSPSGGTTYSAAGHPAGYMPPTAEAQIVVAVAAASSAGEFIQAPAPEAQSSATGSGHGAANQLPLLASGQNAVGQQPQMVQSVSAGSPYTMSAPHHTTQQPASPHAFPPHLWQQQQQPQPLSSGGPGIVVQPAQGGYSGYGQPLHVVTTQHKQQKPPEFTPAAPSFGPPPGSQSAAGPVRPSGPVGPSRGFNVGGPGGYPNNRTGPGSHGGLPPQSMLAGMMAAPVMMGGPGMIGAPPPQHMAPGMMGPSGSSAVPGGRRDGAVGHAGGRHGGPGGLPGPLGQPPVQYSVERPTPNMPQRSNMPDCHSFIKSGSCRFALACKYNHPYNRVGMPIEFDDSPGVVGAQDRAPCDVYLNTGLCTFGDKCRFRHITRGQLAMESAQGISHPDPNQLPKRAGQPPCGFYARTGKCAFGMKCKFDHPTHRNPAPGVRSATIPSTSGPASSPSTEMTNGRQGAIARAPVPVPQPTPQLKGPSEVTARHILVKHKGSRRPASWQDPTGVAIKQRTQAQATATLQALRGSIKTQDDFSKLAMSKSDCSSAKRGGDLGSFARGKMQRAFEDAAFGLQIGGLSGVVSTDSGVHVIMRTA